MSDGRQSESWNHTASMLAALWKIALQKKGRRIQAKHFHPYARNNKRKLSREESRNRLTDFTSSFNGNQRKSPTIRKGDHRTGMNTGPVEKQLKKLEHKMRDFGTGLKSIGSAGLKLSATMAGMLSFPVKLAADLEKSRAEFTALTGDASKAGKMISELEQFALVTPLSSAGLREAARQMMLFGVATEDVVPIVKQLGAISAGDEERMQRLAYAFGQVGQAGRLMGTEVRQFVEAGFNPLAEISRTTGESMEKLRARLEAGGISVGEVSKALETATGKGGRFFGLLDKIGATAIGQLNNLKESFILAVRPLGQELMPLMGKWMTQLQRMLEPLAQWIKDNRELVTSVALLTAKTLAGSIALIALGTTFKSIGAVAKATAVTIHLLSAALKVMYAHPIIAGLALLAVAILGIKSALDASATAAEKFDKEMKRQAAIRVVKNAPKSRPFSGARSAEEGGGGAFAGERAAQRRQMTGGGGIATMGGMLGGVNRFLNVMTQEARGRLLAHRFEIAESRREASRGLKEELDRAIIDSMQEATEAQRLAKERAGILLDAELRRDDLMREGLLTPEMQAQLQALLDAQLNAAGANTKADKLSKIMDQQGIFDARFASQIFGGPNEEEKKQTKLLANIERNTKVNGGGIAVV